MGMAHEAMETDSCHSLKTLRANDIYIFRPSLASSDQASQWYSSTYEQRLENLGMVSCTLYSPKNKDLQVLGSRSGDTGRDFFFITTTCLVPLHIEVFPAQLPDSDISPCNSNI